MINEHDWVVLNRNIPKLRLEAGDIGTVGHVYKDGAPFEVEFVSLDGATSLVAVEEKLLATLNTTVVASS